MITTDGALRMGQEARARAFVARVEILLPITRALIEELGDPDLQTRLATACARAADGVESNS